jgi:hypothetical protein
MKIKEFGCRLKEILCFGGEIFFCFGVLFWMYFIDPDVLEKTEAEEEI